LFKSTVKSIVILFSSGTVLLSVCQSATAQLNIGQRKIQPGLETNYLQYQLGRGKLSDMVVIPGCTVGYGASCNKTGSVLQKLIELNGGPSYNDLLMRAAGGQENYRNFAAFYGNNPNLPEIPVASFWRKESPEIVDGAQYLLGQPISRNSVPGLRGITKNFSWSPVSRGNEFSSPRAGLLDFKFAYGKAALGEVAKIPDWKQQVQSLNLSPEMTQFFSGRISRGLRALNGGSEKELRESILEILSHPYSPGSKGDNDFGRERIGIPQGLNQIEGTTLPGDNIASQSPILLEGEEITLNPDTPSAFEDVVLVPEVGNVGVPLWPVFVGAALLGALVLLLGGGDEASSQTTSAVASQVDTITQPPVQLPCDGSTPGGNGSPDAGQSTGVLCNPNLPPTQPEVKKVVEPSMMKAILLLALVMCILRYRQRTTQIRS
jgi:hypothetical protein